MDVACFCGCRFSCAGDFGRCPGCGEYVSLSRVSDFYPATDTDVIPKTPNVQITVTEGQR
jgi:hypothetical protein